jgi:hypothetical protein
MITLYKNGKYYATLQVKSKLPYVVGLPLDVRDAINYYISNERPYNWLGEWQWNYHQNIAA